MANIIVFMDRDGTITREKGVINHPARLELEPMAGRAIANLNRLGIPVVVITNQPGCARGIVSEAVLAETHQRLHQLLRDEHAHVDGIYVCPHLPPEPGADGCDCHKPKTTLAEQALRTLGVTPERMYMIGDRRTDIEMADNLGATGILVKTGFGLGEWEYQQASFRVPPAYVAENIEDAVRWLLLRESTLTGCAMSLPEPQYLWPEITPDVEKAVIRQLHTSISIGERGGSLAELEDAWAGITQRRFAVSYSSGTMALYAAYRALGIGRDDEVIVPAYGFFATVSPLLSLHAVPVFADVDNSGNLDPEELPRLISTRTKAIVVSHIFGTPTNMRPIMETAARCNIPIVEDASHALGAVRDGLLMGQCGAIAVFSLQAKKLCPAGEGGMLVCDDRDLYVRSTMEGHFKQRNLSVLTPDDDLYPYHTTGSGLKLRLHPLAATIGIESVRRFPAVRSQRLVCARMMWDHLRLSPHVQLLYDDLEQCSGYNLPLVLSPTLRGQRVALMERLRKQGFTHFFHDNLVGVTPHHAIFLHPQVMHPTYPAPSRELPTEWPNAADIQERILCLPLWHKPLDLPIAEAYAKALVRTCDEFHGG